MQVLEKSKQVPSIEIVEIGLFTISMGLSCAMEKKGAKFRRHWNR